MATTNTTNSFAAANALAQCAVSLWNRAQTEIQLGMHPEEMDALEHPMAATALNAIEAVGFRMEYNPDDETFDLYERVASYSYVV